MSQSFELYQPGASRLHSLDARVKLALAACLVILAVVSGSIILLAILLLLVTAGMIVAQVDTQRLRWLGRMVTPPLILIALLWVLLYPSQNPFVSVWFVHLGPDNISQAASISMRLGVIACSTLLWLFVTKQAELVLSLVYLGLPYELGLMLAIAFEQIPGLANTYAIVRQAHTARALAPDEGGLVRRIHATYPMLIATIISSLRRADQLSHVMQARAMGASTRRTSLQTLEFTRRDKRWLISTLMTTSCLLVLRFALHMGATPLWLIG